MGLRRAIRPDAQAFDEVRILTVPRFKTSGLSGDEWRISAVIQLLRKGVIRHEARLHKMEDAIAFLCGEWHAAISDGKGYFAGEDDFCDQEGCAQVATVTYRVKREYWREHPHEYSIDLSDKPEYRRFCAAHSKRGDCGFDDADEIGRAHV